MFGPFYEIFPEKFQNKTNGVTPRRWLAFCNPPLRQLITDTLGNSRWINDTEQLKVRGRLWKQGREFAQCLPGGRCCTAASAGACRCTGGHCWLDGTAGSADWNWPPCPNPLHLARRSCASTRTTPPSRSGGRR